MVTSQPDLFGALSGAIDRAREASRQAQSGEVLICFVGTCDRPAQPEHTPCCSSAFHGKALCCEHYSRAHFVEAHPCSPESHEVAQKAVV